MNNNTILDRTAYSSTSFMLETPQAPKIKAGASSSSDILNRYFTSLSQDLALLTTRTNILATRCSRVDAISRMQGSGYVNLFNSLAARVNAASGQVQVLADMFSAFYVDESNETQIDLEFGQCILPVASSTDLIVSTDIYGNNYIGTNTQFLLCETATATGAPPAIGMFEPDPEGLYMLRGDQSYVHQNQSGNNAVYVIITVPLQYLGFNPNILEIWPLPIGILDLTGVWYQESGTNSTGGWISVDMSYLQGYNANTGYVDKLTPVRLHLPNDNVGQFCFAFNLNGAQSWGLSQIKLRHNEYQSTANLVITDPYARTMGSVLLQGKDPVTVLSNLTDITSANQTIVTVDTTQSSYTPVITGLIIQVS